ncbi:unnamed protein product [Rotaria sp. Silwood2]|nr:unnamed protein product [Rotaria sp. Silwood2]
MIVTFYSLLNDLTSLLQWNRSIYSPNEQNRVENVLPLLREQITTTDSYISHVSQQLTELVVNLRSLEKYILSYINTIPLIDDGMVPSQDIQLNRNHWRLYDENDLDSKKIKESRLQEYDRNGNTHDDDLSKTRSASMSRVTNSDELNHHHFSRDDLRILTKKSNTHVNVNNSNNNDTLTRLATVKSVKRDNKTQPNSILKPYPPTSSSKERKKNFDINTKVFKPNRVDIRDRLIDYDNDDQQLTTNEHIGIMKRKEEIRKMHSKQNIQTTNDQDFNDDYIRSQFNHRKFNKEHERDLMRQSLFHRIEASVSNF